jgi:hypothetical protein
MFSQISYVLDLLLTFERTHSKSHFAAVLQPVISVAGDSGAISAGCSVLSNSPTAGKVIVSGVCGNQSITNGVGVLYNMQFVVVGNVNQQTALSFTNPATSLISFQFNTGISAALTSDGRFTMAYYSASGSSCRILTNIHWALIIINFEYNERFIDFSCYHFRRFCLYQ